MFYKGGDVLRTGIRVIFSIVGMFGYINNLLIGSEQ